MRKIIFLSLITIIVLMSSSCALEKTSDSLDEVRRLADENFELQKEISNIKEENVELKVEVRNLEENIQLARTNQEELRVERSQEILEIINLEKRNKSFQSLFELNGFKLVGNASKEYGKVIYEMIREDRFSEFLEILSSNSKDIIDNVTGSVCEHLVDNNLGNEMVQLLEENKKDSNIDEDLNKYYIITRIRFLINE